jgi:uncharacterized membrane protein YedE/YeeE
MKVTASAFLIGFIFALGLGISGMTQPGRVIGFLDVFGNWDPSLIFVMVGALFVHATLYRLITKRKSPLLADAFQIPTSKSIDRHLLIGAMIFGIGWGLGGFCPAPAMTALASLQIAPFIFVASMIFGMILQKRNQTST